MIGIIDYNAGNIQSVKHSLEFLKTPFILSKNPSDLENVDKIVFPGDGDAAYAMSQLKSTGFDIFLKNWVDAKKPLIGICIGAQIVFDYSEEGNTNCLGFIPGTIRRFSSVWKETTPSAQEKENTAMLEYNLKIPHMGWNDVTFCNGGTKLCNGIADHSDFYFVHSYVIQPDDPLLIKGYAHYGTMVPAIVEYENITVFQFHPEKSGKAGLQILKNFIKDDADGGKSC